MIGFGNLLLWMLIFARHGPTLTVHMKFEPELAGSPWELRIFRLAEIGADEAKPIREMNLQDLSTTIRGLSPDSYRLLASVKLHSASTDIELGARDQADVTLSIQRVRVRGTVLKDGEAVPATLKFIESGLSHSIDQVTTEADGRYETHVWPWMNYAVTVRSEDPARPGWATETLGATAEPEQTRDFTLHQVLVRVTLVDSSTGLPVHDGRLIFIGGEGPTFPPADESGRVEITTLRPGPVELIGKAPGYQTRQRHFEVAQTDDPQDVTLALDPAGPGKRFQALLPSGAPATHVSARYIVGTDEFGLPLPCDAAGSCTAPDNIPDAAMAVFYGRDFGLTVRSLSDVVFSGTIVLDPPGGILTVDVPARPSDSTPVELALTVNGTDVREYLMEEIDRTSGGTGFESIAFSGSAQRLTLRGLASGTIGLRLVGKKNDVYRVPPTVAGPIEVTLPSPPVTLAVP